MYDSGEKFMTTTSDFPPVSDNPFYKLEERLAFTLNPVKPNPSFVDKLQERLVAKPSIVVEHPNRSALFVLFALGLFLAALCAWLLTVLLKRGKSSET
jgi:hypothetical protein